MSKSSIGRRRLILISFTPVLLIALSAIFAPKRTRAEEGMHIKGTFTVAFSGTPNTTGLSFCGGTPSGIAVESHGVGNSTVGAFSVSLQKTIVGSDMHGCLMLTAPNGDTLSATYDGTQGPPNPNNFRDANGTLTFTGGTGRFVGASGNANFTAAFSRIGGTVAPIQGIAFYLVEGTVSAR